MFAELNRGEEVTKGLRKVDRSEMTHKNPELRASGVVPATTASGCKYRCIEYGKRYRLADPGAEYALIHSVEKTDQTDQAAGAYG